jgi:lipoyl-dependent peroxiredoxin subunit D
MTAIDTLREQLPDAARDIKLNLQAVLTPGGTPSLTVAQRWGVAIASAHACRNERLRQAVLEDSRLAEISGEVLEDAKAAAVLMAMNNVYYRFRHMIGREAYSQKPARLRMNRLMQVATNKADFELLCLAVSAINGCEMCLQAHEKVVLDGGLSEDQVHDAVRIAATLHAAAVALEL